MAACLFCLANTRFAHEPAESLTLLLSGITLADSIKQGSPKLFWLLNLLLESVG